MSENAFGNSSDPPENSVFASWSNALREKDPSFYLKLALGLVYIAGVIVFFLLFRDGNIQMLRTWIIQAGPFAFFVFVLLYLVSSLFFLPVVWLNVTAGMMFGPVMGGVFILSGVAVSASAAYFVTRYWVNPDWIRQKLSGKSPALEKVMSRPHSWKTILILRLSNLAPFAVINYASGLMDIPYGRYLLVTLLGSLPGTVISTGLGAMVYALLENL